MMMARTAWGDGRTGSSLAKRWKGDLHRRNEHAMIMMISSHGTLLWLFYPQLLNCCHSVSCVQLTPLSPLIILRQLYIWLRLRKPGYLFLHIVLRLTVRWCCGYRILISSRRSFSHLSDDLALGETCTKDELVE